MIFLNNHVSGFRGSLPWKCRIRFYPPCTYTRENIAPRLLVLSASYCVRDCATRSLGIKPRFLCCSSLPCISSLITAQPGIRRRGRR